MSPSPTQSSHDSEDEGAVSLGVRRADPDPDPPNPVPHPDDGARSSIFLDWFTSNHYVNVATTEHGSPSAQRARSRNSADTEDATAPGASRQPHPLSPHSGARGRSGGALRARRQAGRAAHPRPSGRSAHWGVRAPGESTLQPMSEAAVGSSAAVFRASAAAIRPQQNDTSPGTQVVALFAAARASRGPALPLTLQQRRQNIADMSLQQRRHNGDDASALSLQQRRQNVDDLMAISLQQRRQRRQNIADVPGISTSAWLGGGQACAADSYGAQTTTEKPSAAPLGSLLHLNSALAQLDSVRAADESDLSRLVTAYLHVRFSFFLLWAALPISASVCGASASPCAHVHCSM